MNPTPKLPEPLAARLSVDAPPQPAFCWNREKWLAKFHDLPDACAIVNELPDHIDRQVVRDVVQENLTPDRVLGAFITTQIWGYGKSNYGPYRVRACLTGVTGRANVDAPIDERVAHFLLTAAETVNADGPEAGYWYMNNDGNIKGLGPAFFTKWLSFCSMTGTIDGPEVAPIMDKRVRVWIYNNTAGPDCIDLYRQRTKDYRSYLDLLDAWGAPCGRTRAQVELAIFELTGPWPK